MRGQGGVRSTSPATWVECLVWVAGRGSTELTFLSSCKRRRQCDDFLCPKVTIFVTQATGLALSRGADTLVRRRSVVIRAEVQTLS